VLDPTFGWYVIILYQNNFLGILTQNTGSDFFSSDVAGTVLVCMIGSCVLYIFIFVFITENAFGYVLQQIVSTVFRSSSVSSHMKVKPMMSLQEEEEYSNLLAITTSTATANADANVDNARPGSFPRQRSTGCVDPDVVIEKEKVSQIVERGVLHPKKSAILVHDLRKVYFARGNVPAKVAVKNINITIPQGEIFGLLGANGAGKTTLLKMVSGQELPSSGFALINGYDVVTHTSQAQRSMGLCPQFDTLLERLSVRENLLFFGTMKGVSQKEVVSVVEAFMQAMSIKRYENKLIQQLSGGNRRKVSLAVALMGSPPTVYLDEVSIAVFGDHFL
jgi:ABC-type branched-subunit amino acid transport system ATPase component